MTLPLDSTLPPQPWAQASEALLTLASIDLHAGRTPLPTLAAYSGDDPLAVITLRPFEHDELIQALIEVLALLIPLGTDRVVLSLSGRVWSMDDPIPPVTEDADLRTRAVILTTADAHGRSCAVTAAIHPFEHDTDGWRWLEPVAPDEPPEAPVVSALTVLLDGRDRLRAGRQKLEQQLASQFGRVLLLGHDVALAPDVAQRLELATTR